MQATITTPIISFFTLLDSELNVLIYAVPISNHIAGACRWYVAPHTTIQRHRGDTGWVRQQSGVTLTEDYLKPTLPASSQQLFTSKQE